jgi:curved DNA-binding protein CbpA
MDDSLKRIFEWDEALDESSYYEILGVLEIADADALRSAFHAFSRAFHPDAHIGEGDEVQSAVRRVFQRGAEAYHVLRDPELRIRYDMALAKGQLRLSDPTSRPPQTSSAGKPLDAICRSAGAKLSAQKADKLLGRGELEAAKAELDRALQYDGGANPELAARIADLEIAIYAMGGS